MKYANLHYISDIEPYEVVKIVSDKTILLREMKAVRDDSVKLEVVAGGFSGHTVNQGQQKWIITSNPEAKIIRARKRSDGHFHSIFGKHKISDKARKFYDYNF